MDISIESELSRTFHLAALREEAKRKLSARQWEEQQTIRSRCDAARDKENRLYRERYVERIKKVQRRLIDEAGRMGREMKPRWIGSDRFDRATIFRKAQIEVANAHHRRIGRIDDIERRTLEDQLARVDRENEWRDRTRSEFNRSAEPTEDQKQRLKRQR